MRKCIGQAGTREGRRDSLSASRDHHPGNLPVSVGVFRLGVDTLSGLGYPGLPGLAAPPGALPLALTTPPPLLRPVLAGEETDVGGLQAGPLLLLVPPPVHTVDTGPVVALLLEEDRLVGDVVHILLHEVGNNLLRHLALGSASFSQHPLVLQPFETDQLGVSAV